MLAEIEGQFGPQLTALTAYLTMVCRLPRLVVQRLLEGTRQIPMSLGSTQKAWEEASTAVAGPCQELKETLPHQRVLNAGETGHRTNGDKRWMWTLVARTFIYQIATSPRIGRAAPSAWSQIRGDSRERLAAQLSYLRGHPAPVLLVALHEELPQQPGAGKDGLGEAFLPEGPRAAATTVPVVASFLGRSAGSRRTADYRRFVMYALNALTDLINGVCGAAPFPTKVARVRERFVKSLAVPGEFLLRVLDRAAWDVQQFRYVRNRGRVALVDPPEVATLVSQPGWEESYVSCLVLVGEMVRNYVQYGPEGSVATLTRQITNGQLTVALTGPVGDEDPAGHTYKVLHNFLQLVCGGQAICEKDGNDATWKVEVQLPEGDVSS